MTRLGIAPVDRLCDQLVVSRPLVSLFAWFLDCLGYGFASLPSSCTSPLSASTLPPNPRMSAPSIPPVLPCDGLPFGFRRRFVASQIVEHTPTAPANCRNHTGGYFVLSSGGSCTSNCTTPNVSASLRLNPGKPSEITTRTAPNNRRLCEARRFPTVSNSKDVSTTLKCRPPFKSVKRKKGKAHSYKPFKASQRDNHTQAGQQLRILSISLFHDNLSARERTLETEQVTTRTTPNKSLLRQAGPCTPSR